MLEAWRPARPLDVFFKINTGMNRLGFSVESARGQLERLRSSGVAKSITLMAHFATADGPEGIEEAMRRFNQATHGIDLARSLANTAAIFAHPESHADVARLGIGVYGATPFAERCAQALGLKPAMTLTSELIPLQELAAGGILAQGGTFRSAGARRGGGGAGAHAAGYPRHPPSGP